MVPSAMKKLHEPHVPLRHSAGQQAVPCVRPQLVSPPGHTFPEPPWVPWKYRSTRERRTASERPSPAGRWWSGSPGPRSPPDACGSRRPASPACSASPCRRSPWGWRETTPGRQRSEKKSLGTWKARIRCPKGEHIGPERLPDHSRRPRATQRNPGDPCSMIPSHSSARIPCWVCREFPIRYKRRSCPDRD